MLVAERTAGGQTSPPATPAQPEPTTTRRSPLPILGRAPEVLLISCVGVLVVAWGYARGRAGQPGAEALYWLGQALVFVPVAVRLLARRLAGAGEPFALALGLAVNQYLLKWLYTPDQFRFPDELQHWALTTTLVERGRLFVPDPALPAAVHFPGLEEMGAAVVTLTGLPVTAAGLLVAGVAHLTFVGALFVLAHRIFGSAVVAGLSCVVYATGVHYLFFDSMYLYQTAALPFAVLAVWAVKRWRRDDRRTAPFALVGAVSMVVVTVSHHVTALVLVATLGLLAGCERVAGRRRREPLLAFGFAVVVVA